MKPNQTKTVAGKNEEEYTMRATVRDGHEVIVFERKQEPLRINGFDL